jgi:hypothetical protein
MRLVKLVPLLALAACTDNASKEESVQIFAAASTAMSSAQTKAVTKAQGTPLLAPADLVLDYSGPCTLGGSVALTGTYNGDGSDHAAFDLNATFSGCHEPTGTLDGNLEWTSNATATGFSATMKGGLDWTGHDGEASCDFDLTLTVTETVVGYGGHLCGYDVGAELVIGP